VRKSSSRRDLEEGGDHQEGGALALLSTQRRTRCAVELILTRACDGVDLGCGTIYDGCTRRMNALSARATATQRCIDLHGLAVRWGGLVDTRIQFRRAVARAGPQWAGGRFFCGARWRKCQARTPGTSPLFAEAVSRNSLPA
jgi:hypothetical protein